MCVYVKYIYIQDFPSFRAGLHTHRPSASTAQNLGIERLALAGDWLQTPYPSALMERAVSTGKYMTLLYSNADVYHVLIIYVSPPSPSHLQDGKQLILFCYKTMSVKYHSL